MNALEIKKKKKERYGASCSFIQHKAYLTSFFLFHLIFELLGIFMVMINIIKIELINTAENCWLSILSVRIVFYQLNYFLSIPFLFGQDQGGRGGGGGGGGG